MVAEIEHFMLLKDSRNHLIWSKPHHFADKNADQKVKFLSVYNQGVKSFIKSKITKKQWSKVEDEFEKRGDQVRSCTQYKKIDTVGYLLVPLNRACERQKYTKKES